VKYSTTGDVACLTKAMGCLERYFFLLAFCAYVNEWQSPHESVNSLNEVIEVKPASFREWLSARTEIWRMLETLRHRGPRLFLFRPVEDLSVFARESSESKVPLTAWGENIPVPSELEKFVIKVRFKINSFCRTEPETSCLQGVF
jgi:hypothetical protein